MKRKQKYKKVSEEKFMRLLGGRKMMMQAARDQETISKVMNDPDEWSKIVNFGLPEITDLDGPAEC